MRVTHRLPGSPTCADAPAIASAVPLSARFARFPLARSLAADPMEVEQERWRGHKARTPVRSDRSPTVTGQRYTTTVTPSTRRLLSRQPLPANNIGDNEARQVFPPPDDASPARAEPRLPKAVDDEVGGRPRALAAAANQSARLAKLSRDDCSAISQALSRFLTKCRCRTNSSAIDSRYCTPVGPRVTFVTHETAPCLLLRRRCGARRRRR
jgi:hypothetical protein